MRVERKKVLIDGQAADAQHSNGARSNGNGHNGASGRAHDEQRPVYYISVVAEMVETHPQTLRMYERMGLVTPQRTRSGVRLYSQADVEQVRRIQHLTQELGVNLAGVEVIFDLLREMQRLQSEVESMSPRRATTTTTRVRVTTRRTQR
jgi:MerR family transcriptional regulator/heat shock protein HspR